MDSLSRTASTGSSSARAAPNTSASRSASVALPLPLPLPLPAPPAAAAASISSGGSSNRRSCRSSSLAVSRQRPSGDHLQPLRVLLSWLAKGANAEATGMGVVSMKRS